MKGVWAKPAVIVAVTIVGCTPATEFTRLQPPLDPQSPQAAAPATYVAVVKKEEHPDFAQTVNQINLLQTKLEAALIAAFPFPITIQPTDRYVDLLTTRNWRLSKSADVRRLLDYFADVSGYELTYLPDQKTVQVSSLVTKQYYLPTIIGRNNVQATVSFGGNTGATEKSSIDESDSDAEGISLVRNRYETNKNPEWDRVIAQINCQLETPACSGGEIQGSSAGETSSDFAQNQLGAPAEDGSWMTANKETGLINITSTKQKIHSIDSWLTPLAKALTRFVQLDIALLGFERDKANQTGIDLHALLNGSDGQINVQYRANLQTGTGGTLTFNPLLTRSNASFDLLLNYINSKTNSETLHKLKVIVPAGETATINSLETFFFAAGSQIIPGNTNNQQVSSTKLEEESVGIQLAITPRFLEPEKDLISLRIIPIVSSLVGFDDVVSNGRVISRTPRLSRNHFSSHAIIRGGSALVVGGLTKQLTQSTNNFLPGDTITAFLGGSSQSLDNSEMIAVVLANEIEV